MKIQEIPLTKKTSVEFYIGHWQASMHTSATPNIPPLWLSSNQKIYQSAAGCTQGYHRASSLRTSRVLSQHRNSYFDGQSLQLRISCGPYSVYLFPNKHPHICTYVSTLMPMECDILVSRACIICTSLTELFDVPSKKTLDSELI